MLLAVRVLLIMRRLSYLMVSGTKCQNMKLYIEINNGVNEETVGMKVEYSGECRKETKKTSLINARRDRKRNQVNSEKSM